MPELNLPTKILFGTDSLRGFPVNDYNRMLIISNGDIAESRGFIHSLEQRCREGKAAQVITLINQSISELYDSALKSAFRNRFDIIIAIGSSSAIDCGMAVSFKSGVPFIAIPYCSVLCATKFGENNYESYCKSPHITVLDPILIQNVSSDTIAYDSMACLTFAFDALLRCSNPVIFSIAKDSVVGIIKNIIPAFRGDILSLEQLMYSMYYAAIAQRNTVSEYSSSIINDSNNSPFGFNYKNRDIGIAYLPNILENQMNASAEVFAQIAKESNLIKYESDSKRHAEALIKEIRSIRAMLGIPHSISNSEIEKIGSMPDTQNTTDIFKLYYYGNFAVPQS
jgi:alcohol dehydrogenase class IV